MKFLFEKKKRHKRAHPHTSKLEAWRLFLEKCVAGGKETGVVIAVKCETWTRKNVARINFNLATYVNFRFRQASLRNAER